MFSIKLRFPLLPLLDRPIDQGFFEKSSLTLHGSSLSHTMLQHILNVLECEQREEPPGSPPTSEEESRAADPDQAVSPSSSIHASAQ